MIKYELSIIFDDDNNESMVGFLSPDGKKTIINEIYLKRALRLLAAAKMDNESMPISNEMDMSLNTGSSQAQIQTHVVQTSKPILHQQVPNNIRPIMKPIAKPSAKLADDFAAEIIKQQKDYLEKDENKTDDGTISNVAIKAAVAKFKPQIDMSSMYQILKVITKGAMNKELFEVVYQTSN